MAAALPVRLKQDAIVEALLEIRFDSNELSEIIVGRLSDSELWSGYTATRLGAANLPESIREVDENLRFQAILERRSQDGTDAVRIGSHIISYHMYAPYLGWKTFQSRLTNVVNLLFEKVPAVTVKRLGFRYVNFVTSSKHEVTGVTDLALDIILRGQPVTQSINLNIGAALSDTHHVLSRVATQGFVALEVLPADLVCVLDIDVYTSENYVAKSVDKVIDWVEQAHAFEKEAFFSFFTEETISKLIEE